MSSKSLRILIFHGYLLEGTGSNVYNAQLTQALLSLGHEVHLVAQDRHPERHRFLDVAGDWDDGALRLRALRQGAPRCTLYRPNIGKLLPVYVQDSYEALEAKAFTRCTDAELHAYLAANVEAVREVAALCKPDVALANHLVMGPAILARALEGSVPYAVKVHGSALEYTVKQAPERFLLYAQEGLASAGGVLVGSRHTAESLWRALGSRFTTEHDILARTGLGPPGVDVHRFKPLQQGEAASHLDALASRLSATAAEREDAADSDDVDAFAKQEARAGESLRKLDPTAFPIVAFVGKLIVSKGVDLLLAAWPLVLEAVAEARLVIVGFGALRQALEALLESLAAGDLEAARHFAAAGRELEGGPRGTLRHLLAFLDSLHDDALTRYLDCCMSLRERVLFTGRLDHDDLTQLLPSCETIVVPSTFPEAFGMVAAEGAACGALPVSAAHSGLAEVSATLASEVPGVVRPMLSFPVDDAAVEAIASRIVEWLTLDEALRVEAQRGIVAAVAAHWSWEGVAASVIEAAAGKVTPIEP